MFGNTHMQLTPHPYMIELFSYAGTLPKGLVEVCVKDVCWKNNWNPKDLGPSNGRV